MSREIRITNERDIRTDNKLIVRSGMHGSGIVVRLHDNAKPNKSMCYGCEEDFYNDKNPLGVKECWSFKDAQVVDKVGHSSIHVCGGPDTKMVKTLACWRGVRK